MALNLHYIYLIIIQMFRLLWETFSIKRLMLIICILSGLLIIFPLEIGASQLTIYQGPYSFGVGGEFVIVSDDLNWVLPFYNSDPATKYHIDPNNINSPFGFATFCLEKGEYFNPGSTYDFSISNKAIQGGAGSQGDPISLGTAFLYEQFARGSLSGYDYLGSNRDDDAGVLQATIWWLEGEGSAPSDNKFLNLLGFLSDPKDDNNETYGVAVLNLTALTGGLAQDQLVLVPEASTLMLLGAALIGLVLFVRRKR